MMNGHDNDAITTYSYRLMEKTSNTPLAIYIQIPLKTPIPLQLSKSDTYVTDFKYYKAIQQGKI